MYVVKTFRRDFRFSLETLSINLPKWKGATMKSDKVVKNIKRNTRKRYSSEEKIRIVLEGLRGEVSIAELCRREGIYPNVYYRWSKTFLEAGKKRLEGDTVREASSNEVSNLKKENNQLKQVVAELFLKNRILKKSVTGMEDGLDDL